MSVPDRIITLPFGLSLSKPWSSLSWKKEQPFDKLRANGEN
jgi:hypothetical protein